MLSQVSSGYITIFQVRFGYVRIVQVSTDWG